jgi:phage protein D
VLADLAGQRTDVTVSGWDVTAKRALEVRAGPETVSGELAGGRSGAQVLAAAKGERRERVAATVPLNAQEARTRAETTYRRIARRFLTGHGVAVASGQLRVGRKVRLEHLGDLFSGDYYLSAVTHTFDDVQGWRTEFVAERPGLGGGTP